MAFRLIPASLISLSSSLSELSPFFPLKKKKLTFLHLSVVLADREGQGEKGMQPQGRGLEHGHLPVQVSLSRLNLLGGQGRNPELLISQSWRTNAETISIKTLTLIAVKW